MDSKYLNYLDRLNNRFRNNVGNGTTLFTTDAKGLFDIYLNALDESQRAYHECSACRRFVENYGALVMIGKNGSTMSAIWDEEDAPPLYKPNVKAMLDIIKTANIKGVFVSSSKVWGKPKTGSWHHLSITPPAAMVYGRTIYTAGQIMAQKREDFKNVRRVLKEFSPSTIKQAIKLLSTDSLYRSEKIVGPAKWLQDIHDKQDKANKSLKDNVLWLSVATAPEGFCHPRSSMIGTLLEDIAAGMDYDDISRRFAAKMHPLKYLRPQAAPKAGTIVQAEKLIVELNAAGSLARRFARVDEIQALWKPAKKFAHLSGGNSEPTNKKTVIASVFGHLKPKAIAPKKLDMPSITMTWEKFSRQVLPDATKIEYFVSAERQNFGALVTAVNADAPPILQWDLVHHRNPVSWYIWHGGSLPSEFNLTSGQFYPVEAITYKPFMWNREEKFDHQGKAVIFVIEGAKETKQVGSAIFPECLKSEFHSIRSVIEAYSQSASIQGMHQPHACGLILSHNVKWDALFRVTVGDQVIDYQLDRWD